MRVKNTWKTCISLVPRLHLLSMHQKARGSLGCLGMWPTHYDVYLDFVITMPMQRPRTAASQQMSRQKWPSNMLAEPLHTPEGKTKAFEKHVHLDKPHCVIARDAGITTCTISNGLAAPLERCYSISVVKAGWVRCSFSWPSSQIEIMSRYTWMLWLMKSRYMYVYCKHHNV